MKVIHPLLFTALTTVTATSLLAASQGADVSRIEKGIYVADPTHTVVAARIDHLGFSHTTLRFAKAGGQSCCRRPEASSLAQCG